MKNETIAQKIADGVTRNATIVEVTSTAVYLFKDGEVEQYDSQKQFIDEWFRKFPHGQYHASRDAAKVGNSEQVVKVKVLRGKF